MKKSVDAIIFLPFADKEYEMLSDTIDSIRCYVKESYHIIAVDDYTDSCLYKKAERDFPDITVLRNPRRHGGRSGLYVTQALACKYAIKHFDFKVFIKMDTDALMVGPSLIKDAIARFGSDPSIGILGSYKVRADGRSRNWYRWKLAFFIESNPVRLFFGKPVLWREIIKKARNNDYNIGENILGGCYLISGECISKMWREGCLDYQYDAVIDHSVIGDEIIFSLMCKAVGYSIRDFGMKGDPMVIALDVVPMSKNDVIKYGKAVIHSVKKGWDGETQEELRSYYKSIRTG